MWGPTLLQMDHSGTTRRRVRYYWVMINDRRYTLTYMVKTTLPNSCLSRTLAMLIYRSVAIWVHLPEQYGVLFSDQMIHLINAGHCSYNIIFARWDSDGYPILMITWNLGLLAQVG
jgi:hypothetical protein